MPFERLRPFLFSRRPVHGMFARQSHCINQIMIVDQRASFFHQLVGQVRGYGVFTCTGESVDPDERRRLDVVGHVTLM